MTLLLQMWFLLALGHFVADYPLQSEFIARAKNPFLPVDLSRKPPGQKPQIFWPWVLTAHAGTHAAAVFLITGSVALALAELAAHWLIDFGKCANRYGIHTDQAAHLACKLLWAWIVIYG